MLQSGENTQDPPIDVLLKASRNNSVGVSDELQHGLQRSVEIIANEVLARLDEAGKAPADIENPAIPFATELTRECLRYLYRILFLLYAEARPELGILPAEDGTYEAGYSMARLRELVARDEQLTDEAAKIGFHLFESLNVLFANVNHGHRPCGTEADDEQPGDNEDTKKAKAQRRSEDRGLRFEGLRSDLFEPTAIRLIGHVVDPNSSEDQPVVLDLRLRNAALHEVLRLLTMTKAIQRGGRGGFISYRNLGINQLGHVYEGLMSYTGFLAEEDLCEVSRKGKYDSGSWMIPISRANQYPDEAFVEYEEDDAKKGLRGRKKYPRGSFVYRLAGRDRENSASYYTPESLTTLTVELALKERLKQERERKSDGNVPVRASELLRYKICEPALGSGSFLNETINQVAEEYLRRRQDELGVSISAAQALTEKQKVKAYIALHNCYGVDLNATGVELAEISLWLNTMYPGMRAPWFGLHLRRGNSLIGARRAVYSGEDVTSKQKEWLRSKNPLPPTDLPFLNDGKRRQLPEGAVHQFLLPTPGWGGSAGEADIKALASADAAQLAAWRRGMLKRPSDSKPRTNVRRSQLDRLQEVAKRVEFLWGLVVRRMEISEQEISRKIDLWRADPDDPEYAFLHRPETAIPKEKVYRDLFELKGTPYWRLKTIMDAWCALWFWPVDEIDLLDGTAGEYKTDQDERNNSTLAKLPQLEDTPTQATTAVDGPAMECAEQTPLFDTAGEQESLFSGTTDDDTLSSSVRLRTTTTKTATVSRRPTPRRRDTIPLKDLDDWLDFVEATLGTYGEPDTLLAVDELDSLDKMEEYENYLPEDMGMDPDWKLPLRFPWLHVVEAIAQKQGFLHWELDFALVFAGNGGFDLQIGNPPWVRPRWDEPSVLAEFDPWFKLADKASTQEKTDRRCQLLESPQPRAYVLSERTITSSLVNYFSSSQIYPLLAGTQPDLYRCFMCRTWANSTNNGTIGLLHPDTHFNGDKEAALRGAGYQRLRIHGDFANPGHRFFPRPVDENTHFGIHIYGPPQEIGFDHLSWLVSPDTLRQSADHDGTGTPPGVKLDGAWDARPHRARIVHVDRALLEQWQRLTGDNDNPPEQAKLLSPVSTAETEAIGALADYRLRLGQSPQISPGFHESGDKNAGIIAYNLPTEPGEPEYQPTSWDEVILKGIQIGVATPAFKRHDANSNDPYGFDLVALPVHHVPDTEYVRASDPTSFRAAQDRWIDHRVLAGLIDDQEEVSKTRTKIAITRGLNEDQVALDEVEAALAEQARRPYTDFYRLAWRRQIAPNTERSLYAAIIPPGVTHIDAVHSLAMPDPRQTSLAAGFWASLPLDYLLRTTGRDDLRVAGARSMPAGWPDHPLASALLLRTLRLNCLTAAYADLWAELYDASWQTEEWAYAWEGLPALGAVGPAWASDTPLRSEKARRAVLVELDALVAVWLGMDAEALIALYRARFPVLQRYEASMWFDAGGRKIAGVHRTYGQGQTKEHYDQLQAHLKDPGSMPPPEGYTPPFHKAKREKEMRKAHKVFQERKDSAVARGELVEQNVGEVPGR